MKSLIEILVLFSICMSFAIADGSKGGGGGNAVLCSEQNLELLDLYEVSLRPGLKQTMSVVRTDENEEVQIKRAFSKIAELDGELGRKIQTTYNSFQSDLVEISGEYAWAATDDIGLLPELKCKLVNVINYLSEDVAEINTDLYKILPATDKAALKVHEVLYKIARTDAKATSSLAVRRIVALLFSNYEDKYLLGSLIASYLYSNEKRGILWKVSPNEITDQMYLADWYWAASGPISVIIEYSFNGLSADLLFKKGFLGKERPSGDYKISAIDFNSMPTINVSYLCKGYRYNKCTIDIGVWLQKDLKEIGNNTIAGTKHIELSAYTNGKGFVKATLPIRLVSPKTNRFLTGSLK